ncbi:MAG TPA: hypothetical protein PK178_11985 [Smithellaceae bacterium]|nr:hypothetical protein [Smithellaceae bacterium]
MLEFLFWSVLAVCGGVGLRILLECIFDGGIAFGDTPIHTAYKNEAEAKARELFKNGTGSSKEELQEWWDTYHKK